MSSKSRDTRPDAGYQRVWRTCSCRCSMLAVDPDLHGPGFVVVLAPLAGVAAGAVGVEGPERHIDPVHRPALAGIFQKRAGREPQAAHPGRHRLARLGSVSTKGTSACGLMWRGVPVSSTTGVAQNGHSVAWVAPVISTCAPQFGQEVVRTSTISPLARSSRNPFARSSSCKARARAARGFGPGCPAHGRNGRRPAGSGPAHSAVAPRTVRRASGIRPAAWLRVSAAAGAPGPEAGQGRSRRPFSSRPDRRSRPWVARVRRPSAAAAWPDRPRRTAPRSRHRRPDATAWPQAVAAAAAEGPAAPGCRPQGPHVLRHGDAPMPMPMPAPIAAPPASRVGPCFGGIELHVAVQVARHPHRGALVQGLFDLFRQADVFNVEFRDRHAVFADLRRNRIGDDLAQIGRCCRPCPEPECPTWPAPATPLARSRCGSGS
jgi:hypothetical protein